MSQHELHKSMGTVRINVNGDADEMLVWVTQGVMYFSIDGNIVTVPPTEASRLISVLKQGADECLIQSGEAVFCNRCKAVMQQDENIICDKCLIETGC